MGEALAPAVERDGPVLLALARRSFPDLTPPEERFFRNLGIVLFGMGLPEENDEARTLRADRLAWALMDRRALRLLTPSGVAVRGARIAEQLNLLRCRAGLRLQLDACRLDQAPLLQDARLALLSLQGSRSPGLNADRMQVSGGVFLRGGCTVAGGADFTNAEVGGQFLFYSIKKNEALSLRLSHARVGVLRDDRASWPEAGRLWLDGFRYDRLYEDAEWGLAARKDWLSRHGNSGRFNPQPYEQLAQVCREAGHEADAREVLIEKNRQRLEERRRCLPSLRAQARTWPGLPRSRAAVLPWLFTTLPVWLGRSRGPCRSVAAYWLIWLFGKICAFGYKPWRAAGWWLGVWAVTWPLVYLMAAEGWLLPTMVDQQAGTTTPIDFTSSGFSFDLLTPIFDMGYLAAWAPANDCAALILLGLGAAGYILIALFAASITGLIRWVGTDRR